MGFEALFAGVASLFAEGGTAAAVGAGIGEGAAAGIGVSAIDGSVLAGFGSTAAMTADAGVGLTGLASGATIGSGYAAGAGIGGMSAGMAGFGGISDYGGAFSGYNSGGGFSNFGGGDYGGYSGGGYSYNPDGSITQGFGGMSEGSTGFSGGQQLGGASYTYGQSANPYAGFLSAAQGNAGTIGTSAIDGSQLMGFGGTAQATADAGVGLGGASISGLANGLTASQGLGLASSAIGALGSGSGSGSGLGLSDIAQGVKSLGDVASGVNGLSQAHDLAAAAAAADPLAPYRSGFAAQLAALVADPSLTTKQPGYAAGLEAVQRAGAQQGFTGSGQMMDALATYGTSRYNDQVAQLYGLSVPSAGTAGVGLQGTQSSVNMQNASINRIASGIASMGT